MNILVSIELPPPSQEFIHFFSALAVPPGQGNRKTILSPKKFGPNQETRRGKNRPEKKRVPQHANACLCCNPFSPRDSSV
jgi:hypothetical protein